MTYRESATAEAIIVSMGKALVAFEADSGRIRWTAASEYGVERFFRVGDNILAVGGKSVLCVNAETGRVLGSVPIPFEPQAALVCGADLVLVAPSDAATDASMRVLVIGPEGGVRWRVMARMESTGFLTANTHLQTLDAHGGVSSEARIPMSDYRAGIAFGENVAQPDLIGR
ncbi:MAG: hypothetical protein U0174_16925 [Polyangiaceae bacterium]